MKIYKYYTALIIAMAISTCMVFAQAPVRRISNNNNSSTSHTNVATPPKQNVSNKPAPLNGYHEKTNTDGSVYKGNFKNDLYDGYGEYNSTKFVYKGNFKDGLFHGHGTLVTLNSTIKLSGEFANGVPLGDLNAEVDFGNGSKYEGPVQVDINNMKIDINGKGTLIWSNGSRYVGYFVHGDQTGEGIYTTTDGYKYEGAFVNGLYQGKGVETWKQDSSKPNSSCRVECMYEKGKRHGYGTAYYNDHTYKKGYWENGTMVKVTENGTWHW